MHSRVSTLLLGFAVAAAAVGCTTTSPGDPTAEASASRTSEPTGSGEGGLPSHGAPVVEEPLEVSEFEQDPCKVLTPQQAQDLDVPNSEAREGDFGPECDWRRPGTDSGSLGVTFFSKEGEGLSAVYRQNDNGDFAFFEEIPEIENHPAVSYDIKDEEPTTVCNVSVGLSDSLAFDVRVNLSVGNVGHKDPCETAATVAGMMLKNMKGE